MTQNHWLERKGRESERCWRRGHPYLGFRRLRQGSIRVPAPTCQNKLFKGFSSFTEELCSEARVKTDMAQNLLQVYPSLIILL